MGRPLTDPVIGFDSQAAWEAWLAEHHATSDGVWVKMAKKASGIPTVTHPEALESALCYGWIDGQRNRFDDQWFVQRFTPRRPRSKWSKINRGKAEQLIRDGRMQPAGLREIERARADGRWDAAYDPPSVASVPADLQRALDENPAAAEFFATLNRQNRLVIIYQVQDAKRPDTRARRIAKFVDMLNEGTRPLG
ncbi:MAG TPA: YdeI/OmpD-associated family protein [Acidimicrobiales bacterium]|nr:YdeI/OmpD-associated family protein [Acidimicrobiales bacterium]